MGSPETTIEALESVFQQHANPEIALGQGAYMKDKFEFFGFQSTERRSLQRAFPTKDKRPQKEYLEFILKQLWQKPQREFQYFGLDLLAKYLNQIEKRDIVLYEWLVTHKSWWDTVDAIASKAMGKYFMAFPGQQSIYVEKWLQSQNIWLQRSTILFQLNYKEHTNTELLTYIINKFTGSKEFFINKAIGWLLRNYARVNPGWVTEFVEKTDLSPLSRREALKNIT